MTDEQHRLDPRTVAALATALGLHVDESRSARLRDEFASALQAAERLRDAIPGEVNVQRATASYEASWDDQPERKGRGA